MGQWHDIRRNLRRAITPCLGLLALFYFSYHTVQGERGVIAYLRISAKLERAEMALQDSNEVREALSRRVGLLRPENLDRDMLDEQARRILGLAHPDEIVIYTP